MKNIKRVLVIIIPVVTVIILRVFFFEIYKISSISMEPTLISGDYVLISKMSYGARLLRLRKFIHEKKNEYKRAKGWGKIKKGDVFVFNWPNYNTLTDSFPNVYGGCIVKRCLGMPGDTVIIRQSINKVLKKSDEGALEPKHDLFPNDSTLKWSLDNYGPLYVPAKGHTMTLTRQTVSWHKDILRFENPDARIKDSTLIVNGKSILQYAFKHNYYFMLGDNFYHSQDSRYWGFVPDDNVIGKVVLVLFSVDHDENNPRKFRWARFFKII